MRQSRTGCRTMRSTYPRLPWGEVVMSGAKRVTCGCSLSDIAALMMAGIGVLAPSPDLIRGLSRPPPYPPPQAGEGRVGDGTAPDCRDGRGIRAVTPIFA